MPERHENTDVAGAGHPLSGSGRDPASPELADLIDAPSVHSMMQDFFELTRIPMAIIDLAGNVAVGVGWSDICTRFHRVHPESCAHCIESDTELSVGVPQGEARIYRCKNGMLDAASPVFVGDRHVANIFTGQFFYDDEEPDREYFREQAGRYGFDETEYLAALDRAPRLPRATVEHGISFLVKFSEALSHLSDNTIRLARSNTQLSEMAQRIDAHMGNSPLAVIEFDSGFTITRWSDEAEHVFGWTAGEALGKTMQEIDWIYHEDAALVDAESERLATAAAPRSMNLNRNYRKDGSVIWCEWYDSAIYGEAGELVSILSQVLDVTERVKAEQERAENERLDAALVRIGAEMSASLERSAILASLMPLATDALRASSACVASQNAGRWIVTSAHGDAAANVGCALGAELVPGEIGAGAESRPVARAAPAAPTGGASAGGPSAIAGTTALSIPLLTQGRPDAVLVLQGGPRMCIGPLQMEFASRLAGMAALALDNAQLYERERRIADTLQEAILSPLQPIDGLDVACLYRPASTGASVGGDFYDLFEMDGGIVGLTVGDISGKGIEAARLTSLVRDGVRAYAYERPDPAFVLARVNDLFQRTSPVDLFATLFFGAISMAGGSIEYASGGHPPAMMCRGGEVRPLGAHSSIVGVFTELDPTSATEPFVAGDRIVLYTDGVVEARTDGVLFGEERLVDALRSLARVPTAELPDALLARVLDFTGGSLQDDVVIMVAERTA